MLLSLLSKGREDRRKNERKSRRKETAGEGWRKERKLIEERLITWLEKEMAAHSSILA